MRRLILTLQFLTRIPIPVQIDIKENDFAKGIIYFPIAGLVIGSFCSLVYLGADYLLNGYFPILCAILANVLVTGGFHLDGLADTCDGIYSARPLEQMLEIMRDSRVGTNGVLAIVFDLLFRMILLAAIPSEKIVLAILLAPVAAKTMQSVLMYRAQYARKGSGLGNFYIGKISIVSLFVTLFLGKIILFGFLGMVSIYLFGICLLCGIFYRYYIQSKIQGMTGDTLGAGSEVVEIVCLLVMALLGRIGIL